jgi:hypothetical protein
MLPTARAFEVGDSHRWKNSISAPGSLLFALDSQLSALTETLALIVCIN